MACKTFHKGSYFVAFKRGFENFKRDITVTINRVFESDSLSISLSDDEDPSFLCVLHVTRCDYEDLKKQQGLLIDFDNFPAQLVKLLQQCAANNMFLIMQQTNPLQFYFEIVEHNEFKKLVHLSLKTGPATDADIKQHMATNIRELKKMLSEQKAATMTSEVMWNDRVKSLEHKTYELSQKILKLEEDKLRQEEEHREILQLERDKLIQERLVSQKNADINLKAQLASSQDIINKKDKQIEELNGVCRQYKDNISQLELRISEKGHRLNVLENEVQKSHIEVATLKAKNATLEREATDNDRKYNQLNAKCTFLEKTVKENSDVIRDLNNSLQLAKKEKISLEERLAISESIATKNNEAANSTSTQLMKANQIITKLNTDFMEIKEKLLCRTAIALEQEKVIEHNTKEIADLKSQILSTSQAMEQIQKELDVIKEKYETQEKALQDRDETIRNNNMVIQWLHKKMEGHVPNEMIPKPKSGIQSASSSTPYFVQRNSNQINMSDPASEESINFYATSKISNIDNESSREENQDNPNRIGLDPKYLKPATDDNAKSTQSKAKIDIKNAKGKENQGFQLPKVDYREKKSSRSTTYRATPVSAYFP